MPTPNGRLHLGHIAGPFLRMDVLARHVRRRGDDVAVIFGTDAYDSYISLSAQKDGGNRFDICQHYHALILDDLESMNIQVDAFINPLEPEWRESYHQFHQGFAKHLIDKGQVEIVREKVPYSPADGLYMVGGFLSGRCPDCLAEVANYLCERCGGHLRPESLLSPQPRFNTGPIEWRTVESVFIRIPDKPELLPRLVDAGIPPDLINRVGEYMQRHGNLVRLTTPGTWGVPIDSEERVLFSYTSLLPYSLYCGQVYAEMNSVDYPFALDSDVLTTASCGTDNLVSGLASVLGGAMAHGDVKPFDRLLLNHLYNLEGQKFSTSRGHAIWVNDITKVPTVPVDSIRYFLALVNPEDEPASLNVSEFIDTHNNDLATALTAKAEIAAGKIRQGMTPEHTIGGTMATELALLFDRQEKALDAHHVSTATAARSIREWVHSTPPSNSEDAYWWLKGLALLSSPIMPDLAGELWRSLGHSGEPTLAHFPIRTAPWTPALPTFTTISRADLASCLPESLNNADLAESVSEKTGATSDV
ncbi:class I tRNA ligase family protein [Herbihabitans rhizosphaerae]|nr:class I tRNA ligase family protein [Herbihabitans rhizosphaerae]